MPILNKEHGTRNDESIEVDEGEFSAGLLSSLLDPASIFSHGYPQRYRLRLAGNTRHL